MTIREAVLKDIEKILPIRLQTHQYHYELDSMYEPKVNLSENFATQLQSLINEQNSVVLIAEENNSILGYALGKLRDPHPLFKIPASGMIDDVGVIDSARHKGIGTQLVNELSNWFKVHGAQRIDLKVHDKNTAGLNFWIKMGFHCSTRELCKSV